MTNLEGQALDLFEAVLGLSPDQRDALLHAAWDGPPELRARVKELLADHREAETIRFLEPPPLPRSHPTEELPRRFGDYELLQKPWRGGMGVVYRARQVHSNKEVALKVVNSGDRCRALRELEVAANLEHKHLVGVNHVGEHDGSLYFTMKLAEGSLAERLEQHSLRTAAPTSAAERAQVERDRKRLARFMAKVARAVDYLHGRGIIHRDLKPGNILLDAQDEPLVADFGLALRAEEPADGAGTPGYMAPEQAQRLTRLTRAVDVWGLGAVLYKLLTGRTPFDGTEIINETADPERLVPSPSAYNDNIDTGSELGLICLECLAKEPDRRYPSASALADDLERYARGEETSVRPRGWLERVTRPVVEAINHKVPLPGIARWGAIDLWDAGLNLALHGALFALIRTDQPPALLWLALLTYGAVWWWMFLTYLFRHDSVDPTERHLALLWGGVFLGCVTLFWIYCPPFGSGRAADLLAFYPPQTVVNGVAFLVVGRLYCGHYYLVGLAHFLVAALMPLCLDLAPLVYGVFVAVCLVLAAVDNIRTARRVKDSARAR
jgi:serine/threonine-protein kinase